MYKVVQIWPGLFVCKHVTVYPGHIWTTLYFPCEYWVLSVTGLSDGSICRAVESFPLWRAIVWSRSLKSEAALIRVGLSSQKKQLHDFVQRLIAAASIWPNSADLTILKRGPILTLELRFSSSFVLFLRHETTDRVPETIDLKMFCLMHFSATPPPHHHHHRLH
jgi:hypothetical protein